MSTKNTAEDGTLSKDPRITISEQYLDAAISGIIGVIGEVEDAEYDTWIEPDDKLERMSGVASLNTTVNSGKTKVKVTVVISVEMEHED